MRGHADVTQRRYQIGEKERREHVRRSERDIPLEGGEDEELPVHQTIDGRIRNLRKVVHGRIESILHLRTDEDTRARRELNLVQQDITRAFARVQRGREQVVASYGHPAGLAAALERM